LALLNPNIIKASLRFVYKGGKAKYEERFRKALEIAAPDDANSRTNGHNAFLIGRDIDKNMTNEIANNILFIASNGDEKRYQAAVNFFDVNLHRRSKFSRYKKWLWLAGAILLVAIVIYLGIKYPGKVFFFF
jgi:hypothetical protein